MPLRIFFTIVLVGGPVASALAFLLSEYHWRREIPLFFPDGVLERDGVLRVPIRVRLFLTFLLTSILPRFASEPHKEPRAPQNLYPIAGLEHHLRHRLGDPHLLERALRVTAAAPAVGTST